MTESYRRDRKRAAGAGALALLAVVVWTFVRYRPSRVAVRGPSMSPTLQPGDWASVVTPARFDRGDVVVVEQPGRPRFEMVKRIVGAPGDVIGQRTLGADEWWIEGDFAPGSTDSRHFGPVTTEALKSKVVLVYWPPARRGRVR